MTELSTSEQINRAEIEALLARKNLDPSIPPEGVESYTPNKVVAGSSL